jgi:CMP-N,N'-diacetyllegionaminic acid synthase
MREETLEVLAVIPARGGSKSIPRKNLRLLAGKPLIVHSIEQARQSAAITRVIVSTDDEEIARIARQHGAEVPFLRPVELAQDETPDLPVFQHALRWLQDHEGYHPDLVVHLRPTTPTRRVETMDRAIRLYAEHPEADALRSVSPAHHSPYKMWLITPEGLLEPVVRLRPDEAYNLPRQALPQTYWGNGYVDVTRPAVILGGSMTGRRILAFLVEEPCVDIDQASDLDEAARLLSLESPQAAR